MREEGDEEMRKEEVKEAEAHGAALADPELWKSTYQFGDTRTLRVGNLHDRFLFFSFFSYCFILSFPLPSLYVFLFLLSCFILFGERSAHLGLYKITC